ncbi:hypothetical protein I4100191B2_07630 [Clostridiales bacterium]
MPAAPMGITAREAARAEASSQEISRFNFMLSLLFIRPPAVVSAERARSETRGRTCNEGPARPGFPNKADFAAG